MDKDFRVFDFHRIFLGDAPILFLLEIVFRTVVMYLYALLLLRILGKRGMGQLSMLELAIIIAFGSAVGDPMVGANMPILHGITAITVVTFLQIGLERLINKNKKMEAVLEGSANTVVEDGIIKWDCMKHDNLSKEDLMRSLRGKDVQHLGQLKKAIFETSGQISVFFQPPKKVKPGLTVLPENGIRDFPILAAPSQVPETRFYSCLHCGHTQKFEVAQQLVPCPGCHEAEWVHSEQ